MISAGDDYDGSGGPGTGLTRDTLEIYSPPYLFKGSRPTITGARPPSTRNTTFAVATPNANITRAVLIAPAATTHANDTNQRALQLPVHKRDERLGTLTSPTGPTAAPPATTCSSCSTTNGVPSVAKFVKLTAGGAAPSKCVIPPPDPPDDPPDPPDPPDDPKPPVKNPPIIKPPTPPVNKAPVVTKLKLSGQARSASG